MNKQVSNYHIDIFDQYPRFTNINKMGTVQSNFRNDENFRNDVYRLSIQIGMKM